MPKSQGLLGMCLKVGCNHLPERNRLRKMDETFFLGTEEELLKQHFFTFFYEITSAVATLLAKYFEIL